MASPSGIGGLAMRRVRNLLVTAMLVLALPTTVGATTPAARTDVLQGVMEFGRTHDCADDGSGSTYGDGLYFPGLYDHSGVFRVDAISLLGQLRLCGDTGPSVPLGIGAACGFYSGSNGKGTLDTFDI